VQFSQILHQTKRLAVMEALNELIPFMPFDYAQESVRPIRRAHGRRTPSQGAIDHEGNQQVTVCLSLSIDPLEGGGTLVAKPLSFGILRSP
jgi:hypothetical protein